jgi:GNAT superfamily N-acetyltransferase
LHELVAVRPALEEDAPALVELISGGSLVSRDVPADISGYRRAIAEIARSPGSELLVADVGGEVVGMCQLITFRHFQEGGGLCAELESAHVRADMRGRGVGGVLIRDAVSRARAAGCYRVQLTSNLARTDAHRFWEREGFQATHLGFKLYL